MIDGVRLAKIIRIFLPVVAVWVVTAGQIVSAAKTGGEPVIIGLLIQDKNSREARYGAEMAVRQINRSGGIDGKPVQLVVRSMEGPWGTGSKQAVDLIFEEKVWAILGSHDGRNAHLVEQVTAKTQVPFVSAWAADPTLSQAFVPWFFNLVPNSRQQAGMLVQEIYSQQMDKKVVIVTHSGYDSEAASGHFEDATKKQQVQIPPVGFTPENGRIHSLVNYLKNAGAEGVVLTGSPVQFQKEKRIPLPVYGFLSVFDEDSTHLFSLQDYEGMIVVSPGYLNSEKGKVFSDVFQQEYGRTPGPVAAFAFDGLNVIAEAVKNSKGDRNQVGEYLKKTNQPGVTGRIRFDQHGNRLNPEELVEIKNGIVIPVEKLLP